MLHYDIYRMIAQYVDLATLKNWLQCGPELTLPIHDDVFWQDKFVRDGMPLMRTDLIGADAWFDEYEKIAKIRNNVVEFMGENCRDMIVHCRVVISVLTLPMLQKLVRDTSPGEEICNCDCRCDGYLGMTIAMEPPSKSRAHTQYSGVTIQ